MDLPVRVCASLMSAADLTLCWYSCMTWPSSHGVCSGGVVRRALAELTRGRVPGFRPSNTSPLI